MSFDKVIKGFKKRNILVIGDLLLDQYIWGKVSRISPEAPVPVVWVNKEEYIPGGACNVANNLSYLGAKVYLCGVIGDDTLGTILTDNLISRDINCVGVISDKGRPTSQKTRVIAHNQQVVRIDRESVKEISVDEVFELANRMV